MVNYQKMILQVANEVLETILKEDDSLSASEEIPRTLLVLNPNVHYHVHNNSLLAYILSQMNPITLPRQISFIADPL